jgi:hypothetical protein
MTNLVDQYFAVLKKIGIDDFDHPQLEALRRQMSDADLQMVHTRLVEEDEALEEEADALEKFGQRRFGAKER